jgi:hypothetical protein
MSSRHGVESFAFLKFRAMLLWCCLPAVSKECVASYGAAAHSTRARVSHGKQLKKSTSGGSVLEPQMVWPWTRDEIVPEV